MALASEQPVGNGPTTATKARNGVEGAAQMEFVGDIKVSQKRPTRAELEAVAAIPILNSKNESVPFQSLYEGNNNNGQPRRVLILFIRHFFCGNCQEYLRTLCSSITPAALAALPTPTEIIVIGCGSPELIAFYATETRCLFPIYAEPTKEIYSKLGMARTLNLGAEHPQYMQQPLVQVMLKSVLQSLSNGRKAFKGGDYWQVGGEFLFDQGEVSWCHRMVNTRGHAEVPELRRRLGLDEETAVVRKRWSLGGAGIRRSMSRKRQSWSRSRSRGLRDSSREGSLMEGVKEEREDAGNADQRKGEQLVEAGVKDEKGTVGEDQPAKEVRSESAMGIRIVNEAAGSTAVPA